VGTGTYGVTGAADTTDGTRTTVVDTANAFPNLSTGAAIADPNKARDSFPIRSGTATENYADLICNTPAVNTPYMVSMERIPSFGAGTVTASWAHATKNMTDSGGNGGKGTYIKADYRDRTIATPGEINSRWSALP
jgi:transcription elongation factor